MKRYRKPQQNVKILKLCLAKCLLQIFTQIKTIQDMTCFKILITAIYSLSVTRLWRDPPEYKPVKLVPVSGTCVLVSWVGMTLSNDSQQQTKASTTHPSSVKDAVNKDVKSGGDTTLRCFWSSYYVL